MCHDYGYIVIPCFVSHRMSQKVSQQQDSPKYDDMSRCHFLNNLRGQDFHV